MPMNGSVCKQCNGDKETNGLICQACMGTGTDSEKGSTYFHKHRYDEVVDLYDIVSDLTNKYTDLLQKYNELKAIVES